MPDFSDLRLDPVDDVERVLAVAHDHDTADGLAFTVPLRDPFAQIGTIRHDPQIAHEHRRAIVGRDGDLLDIRQGPDVADSSHQVVCAGHFQHPAAYLIIAGPDPVDDGLQGDVQSQQAVWIQPDLILSNETTDRRDFGDPRHGLERIANLPVLQASQIGQVEVMAAINQDILIDPTGSRSVGADNRMYAGGQLACQLLHVFEHSAARPIDVSPVLEDHEHIRVVEHGLRPNRLHVRRGKHGRYDRIGNLIFDYVGRLPHPFGVNDDLHIGNVRESVERDQIQRPDAAENQRCDGDEYEEAVVITPIDNLFDHETSSHCHRPGDGDVELLVGQRLSVPAAAMVTCQVPPLSRSISAL